MNKNIQLFGGGFHHIALGVSDFERSLKFYTEIMGFKVSAEFPHPKDPSIKKIAMLDTGDGNHLEIIASPVEKPARSDLFIHVAFRSENIDAVIAKVRLAGVEIVSEPQDIELATNPPSIIRNANIKGPDGEVLELFQSKSGIML